MTIEPELAAELLGRALRDDRVAVLVGSSASASAMDTSGRSYDGLPTPTEFVRLCAAQLPYVKAAETFAQACDRILDREDRRGLEELLLRYYRVPNAFEPPPAHRILSWLPISLYLTSNYDEFIERALARESRPTEVLIEDADLVRFRRDRVAVVKYHGCVTRPSTLVAASSDEELLDQRRGLVTEYLRCALAGKVLLVVGHGLGDRDFTRSLSIMMDRLKEYAPSVYVLRQESHEGRLPGAKFKHEVVCEDLTRFLSRLHQEVRRTSAPGAGSVSDDGWLTSAFFAALRKAAVLPSETQVLDAFLKHLAEELAAGESGERILADADAAVHMALAVRPNYEALRKVWSGLKAELAGCDGIANMQLVLGRILAARSHLSQKFGAWGGRSIRRNERILLYSQSQRVAQVLLGVPGATQKTVHLFVAECRPKSPRSYQDAAAFCALLAESYYLITVCPDVVAGTLLASHQIDRVLLGTHAVFCEAQLEAPHSFVNTCGSSAIARMAGAHGVPVDIIGESLKIELVSSTDASDRVHLGEEHDLVSDASVLTGVRTKRADVRHLNVGYDIVRLTPGITIHFPDLSS